MATLPRESAYVAMGDMIPPRFSCKGSCVSFNVILLNLVSEHVLYVYLCQFVLCKDYGVLDAEQIGGRHLGVERWGVGEGHTVMIKTQGCNKYEAISVQNSQRSVAVSSLHALLQGNCITS